jgi:hypothetical protein
MRIPFACCCAFLSLAFLSSGCRNKDQKADIPDVEGIYGNIQYLDSLMHSSQTDSIGRVSDHISEVLDAYTNRAETPEDKAILDSLTVISRVTSDFLQFCTGTATNLELLEQDTRSVESLYRSGKIKITAYTASLLEADQTLVDLREELAEKNLLALQYLGNQEKLIEQLSALPVKGN